MGQPCGFQGTVAGPNRFKRAVSNLQELRRKAELWQV
jgi:hypothetical protein